MPRGAGRLLRALSATLAALPAGTRDRILRGPDLRGFLSETETWLAIRRLATAVIAIGSRPRGRRRRARALARLFDRIARTEHLVRLVPGGRIEAGFAGRCLAFSRVRLDDVAADLSAFLLGVRLAHPATGDIPLRLRLRVREDPEQGRPPGRIDLGAVVGPAGALAIAVGRRGRRPRLVHRVLIPGTSIILTPVVDSRPDRMRVRRDAPGLGARLARALRVLALVWPEAHQEVLRRTFMVVPVREPGTVSWSLASRPGISFIHVSGKSIVDLTDDLLHETAHHRLHDVQEVARLLAGGPETAEVQAFDSPWRGARRPLHGLLHGTYTFLFRAELLARLLRAARRGPGRLAGDLRGPAPSLLRTELRRERRMIDAALRDLAGAARAGLLTPAGCGLVRSMRSWRARQSRVRGRR